MFIYFSFTYSKLMLRLKRKHSIKPVSSFNAFLLLVEKVCKQEVELLYHITSTHNSCPSPEPTPMHTSSHGRGLFTSHYNKGKDQPNQCDHFTLYVCVCVRG